jgi:hypothetical protein
MDNNCPYTAQNVQTSTTGYPTISNCPPPAVIIATPIIATPIIATPIIATPVIIATPPAGDPRCTDPNRPYYYYGNTCTSSDDANGVSYCGEEGISGICGPGTGPECFVGCGGTCCGGHV